MIMCVIVCYASTREKERESTGGIARIWKGKEMGGGGGANDHDYITLIVLKASWINRF